MRRRGFLVRLAALAFGARVAEPVVAKVVAIDEVASSITVDTPMTHYPPVEVPGLDVGTGTFAGVPRTYKSWRADLCPSCHGIECWGKPCQSRLRRMSATQRMENDPWKAWGERG